MKHLILVIGPAMSGKTTMMESLNIHETCCCEELDPNISPSDLSRILKKLESSEEFNGSAAATVTMQMMATEMFLSHIDGVLAGADWSCSFMFTELVMP